MNKNKIKVKFVELDGEICALFPDLLYNERLYGQTMIESYMIQGEHSGASRDLMKRRFAPIQKCRKIISILESRGYDLEILRRKSK